MQRAVRLSSPRWEHHLEKLGLYFKERRSFLIIGMTIRCTSRLIYVTRGIDSEASGLKNSVLWELPAPKPAPGDLGAPRTRMRRLASVLVLSLGVPEKVKQPLRALVSSTPVTA